MWAICIHHISSLTAPGLVGWSQKVHISFKKNPPVKFSGYGPVCDVQETFVNPNLQAASTLNNRAAT